MWRWLNCICIAYQRRAKSFVEGNYLINITSSHWCISICCVEEMDVSICLRASHAMSHHAMYAITLSKYSANNLWFFSILWIVTDQRRSVMRSQDMAHARLKWLYPYGLGWVRRTTCITWFCVLAVMCGLTLGDISLGGREFALTMETFPAWYCTAAALISARVITGTGRHSFPQQPSPPWHCMSYRPGFEDDDAKICCAMQFNDCFWLHSSHPYWRPPTNLQHSHGLNPAFLTVPLMGG